MIKRYTMLDQPAEMVQVPDGEWVKWEDHRMVYPIHNTASGPNKGKPVVFQGKPVMTHNPIPEGARFMTVYDDKEVTFKVDMNFHTNPTLVMVEVLVEG